MRLKWKLVWVHLEIVLILAQERCMVSAQHTIGVEIVFNAPDGTPTAQVESCFGMFGDSVSISAR